MQFSNFISCYCSYTGNINMYCTAFTDGSSIPSAVEVGVEDFREAISSLTPSVSKEDLAYFQGIWDRH
jgi:hypothetical protein